MLAFSVVQNTSVTSKKYSYGSHSNWSIDNYNVDSWADKVDEHYYLLNFKISGESLCNEVHFKHRLRVLDLEAVSEFVRNSEGKIEVIRDSRNFNYPFNQESSEGLLMVVRY